MNPTVQALIAEAKELNEQEIMLKWYRVNVVKCFDSRYWD